MTEQIQVVPTLTPEERAKITREIENVTVAGVREWLEESKRETLQAAMAFDPGSDERGALLSDFVMLCCVPGLIDWTEVERMDKIAGEVR